MIGSVWKCFRTISNSAWGRQRMKMRVSNCLYNLFQATLLVYHELTIVTEDIVNSSDNNIKYFLVKNIVKTFILNDIQIFYWNFRNFIHYESMVIFYNFYDNNILEVSGFLLFRKWFCFIILVFPNFLRFLFSVHPPLMFCHMFSSKVC